MILARLHSQTLKFLIFIFLLEYPDCRLFFMPFRNPILVEFAKFNSLNQGIIKKLLFLINKIINYFLKTILINYFKKD